MNKDKKQYVIFAGGETAGPVVPLLALAKAWQIENADLVPVFVDKKYSVAARMVPHHGYAFKTIMSGKFRRYWSLKNVWSPFQILIGIIQSFILLVELKPVAVIGAGGYVQIPIIVAAWALRIPRVIHQQDIARTVSNKLAAPFANKVTVTFQKSLKDFSQGLGFSKNYSNLNKLEWTGNPCAISAASKDEAIKMFHLDKTWPTVLVIGGGSGAMGLNHALAHSLPELLSIAHVIHSTGPGKMIKHAFNSPAFHDRYHQYEFIDRMDLAYAAADIVIARAGIGTITELSQLEKLSIIVPMPDSHQELNAQFLFDHKAAIVVDQSDINDELLAKIVKKILFDLQLQKSLQSGIKAIMPSDATKKMLQIIQSLINA